MRNSGEEKCCVISAKEEFCCLKESFLDDSTGKLKYWRVLMTLIPSQNVKNQIEIALISKYILRISIEIRNWNFLIWLILNFNCQIKKRNKREKKSLIKYMEILCNSIWLIGSYCLDFIKYYKEDILSEKHFIWKHVGDEFEICVGRFFVTATFRFGSAFEISQNHLVMRATNFIESDERVKNYCINCAFLDSYFIKLL